MSFRVLLAAPLLLFAVPAQAQEQESSDPPQRVRSVILFGDEKCPPATDPDEIVVCAEGGDSPYRIPKRFRQQPAEGPASVAWGRRAEIVEEVNRAVIPGNCSVIGAAGQTGCTRQMIRQWYQERVETEAKKAREQ